MEVGKSRPRPEKSRPRYFEAESPNGHIFCSRYVAPATWTSRPRPGTLTDIEISPKSVYFDGEVWATVMGLYEPINTHQNEYFEVRNNLQNTLIISFKRWINFFVILAHFDCVWVVRTLEHLLLGLSELAILVLVCQFFVSWGNTRVGFGESLRILFVKVEDSL